MITEQDLREAIAECEGARNPDARICIKLAAYYTIYDHLYGGKPTATETRYSTAPPPQAGNGGTISYEGDSDFAQAVQGKPADAILPIIDEIMEAVRALTPRLYNAAIDKLRDLP